MAGSVLKTVGIIFIVIGGLVLLTGLGAAILGGVAFSDAVDDAGRTELAEERAEMGAIVGLSGLAGMAVGLVGVVVGIVLLMWGVHRAKQAHSSPETAV